MSYIGNVGDSNTSINSDFSKYTYEYIATAGQTTFTGTDINSAVLGYTVGNIIVSYGGADLAFSDYTATNGTSVVLADGALVGKILRVVAFEAFELADAYTKTQIDANTYTKTQIDANTYTQSQADTLLAAKATVANFTSTGIDDNAASNAVTINSSQQVGIGTDNMQIFNAGGGGSTLVVTAESNNTNVLANTGSNITIANGDGTADNTAALHFAREDTDGNPNYAGASVVSQFKETQVTGQYPKADLAFLTSTAANNAPSEKMRIDAAGNVGIGCVPESGISGDVVELDMVLGSMSAWSSESNPNTSFALGYNCYSTGGIGTHKAKKTSSGSDFKPSVYEQVYGQHYFKVAPSGSADAAISWNTAMTIDNAGIVTKPLQPSFRVGSVTYVTTGTTILHTIDFHDIGNNYNPANGRFTAPVAGVYYFGAQAISGSASTNSEQNLKFMKNGSAVCDARARSYTESSLHLKTVIELAVGDYMNVVVDSGSVYAASNGFHNQFMGYLIG